MHIHTPEFAELKEEIADRFPDHVIAFDVVFQTDAGTSVDFHVDFESLGPFDEVDWKGIRDHYFVSVHFNLTPNGGHLVTVAEPYALSVPYHAIISQWGIYSLPHRIANALTRPLLHHLQTVCPNNVDVGNSFDNMRLHGVTAGDAERVSYVVRLVKRGCVTLSPESLRVAATRSAASATLSEAISPHVHRRVDVSDLPWGDL